MSVTLIYDGECGFCKRWVDRIRKRNPAGSIRFVSCQSEERKKEFSGIQEEDCLKAMQAVLPEGRILAGADAAPFILRELPRWRWCALLFEIPGVLPMSRWIYGWIAHNRNRLSCGSKKTTDTCNLSPKT